jgi:hypothetical protein
MLLNMVMHKILAIGSPIMVRRLQNRIDLNQFKVIPCHNSGEAENILASEEIDMVIIGDLFSEAESICRRAAIKNDTPVALLLQEKPVNWRERGHLKVDGFLSDGGTNAEMTARIRALIRRKPGLSPFNCN